MKHTPHGREPVTAVRRPRFRDTAALSLYCVPAAGWVALSVQAVVVVLQVLAGAAGGWPVTAAFPDGLFWGLATQLLGTPWTGSTLTDYEPSLARQALFALGPSINLALHAGVWAVVGYRSGRRAAA